MDEVRFSGIDGVSFLEIRGRAEAVSGQVPADPHLAPEIIRIHPRRVLAFNIDPERPGLQTRNVPLDGGIAARDGSIAARDAGIAAR